MDLVSSCAAISQKVGSSLRVEKYYAGSSATCRNRLTERTVPEPRSPAEEHTPCPRLNVEEQDQAPKPPIHSHNTQSEKATDEHTPRCESSDEEHITRSEPAPNEHTPCMASTVNSDLSQPRATVDDDIPRPESTTDQHSPNSESTVDEHITHKKKKADWLAGKKEAKKKLKEQKRSQTADEHKNVEAERPQHGTRRGQEVRGAGRGRQGQRNRGTYPTRRRSDMPSILNATSSHIVINHNHLSPMPSTYRSAPSALCHFLNEPRPTWGNGQYGIPPMTSDYHAEYLRFDWPYLPSSHHPNPIESLLGTPVPRDTYRMQPFRPLGIGQDYPSSPPISQSSWTPWTPSPAERALVNAANRTDIRAQASPVKRPGYPMIGGLGQISSPSPSLSQPSSSHLVPSEAAPSSAKEQREEAMGHLEDGEAKVRSEEGDCTPKAVAKSINQCDAVPEVPELEQNALADSPSADCVPINYESAPEKGYNLPRSRTW